MACMYKHYFALACLLLGNVFQPSGECVGLWASWFNFHYMVNRQSSVFISYVSLTPCPLFQVQDGSPGHKAGLEAFFDFIVAIGNTRLVSFLRLQ